jgi:excinuclease UvrABC nuclease subunit
MSRYFQEWDKCVKSANITIDVFCLPSVRLFNYSHNKLPHISAIYFVVNTEQKIVYIGSSIDLRRRFQNHYSQKHFFWENQYTVFYLESVLTGKNDPVEAAFIRKYRPFYNRKIA